MQSVTLYDCYTIIINVLEINLYILLPSYRPSLTHFLIAIIGKMHFVLASRQHVLEDVEAPPPPTGLRLGLLLLGLCRQENMQSPVWHKLHKKSVSNNILCYVMLSLLRHYDTCTCTFLCAIFFRCLLFILFALGYVIIT